MTQQHVHSICTHHDGGEAAHVAWKNEEGGDCGNSKVGDICNLASSSKTFELVGMERTISKEGGVTDSAVSSESTQAVNQNLPTMKQPHYISVWTEWACG